MKFNLLASIILLIGNASALNILGIFPYQGNSHFIVFKVLLKELARRGHNVTVISHFPEKEPPANYHDISLAGSTPIVGDVVPLHNRNILTHLAVGYFVTTSGRDICDILLANEQVINLVKEKRKFDVALVELFNSDCGLGIAYKLDTPVVSVTSHIMVPWNHDKFGLPSNPSHVPFHFSDGGSRPTLLQKVERVLLGIYYKFMYSFVSQRNNQASLEKRFGSMPSLEDLGREIKFVLLYQHYTLTGRTLMPSNLIEVGGYHIPKAKALTDVSTYKFM
jgi:glucuronosyltransferase